MARKDTRSEMANREVQPAGLAGELAGAETSIQARKQRADDSATDSGRYYMKGAVCTAEKINDRWLVKGRCWSGAMEFSDEDFQRNFEAL